MALRIAYAANIVILAPVLVAIAFGRSSLVFQSAVDPSPGLLALIGILWAAILFASIAGLFQPDRFASVLLIQIVYKTLWLLAYALPSWRAGLPVPTGVAAVFLVIVVTYPVLLAIHHQQLAQ